MRAFVVPIMGLLAAASLQGDADVIHYWRFEEGSGYYADDSADGVRGDLIGTPGVQWSTDVPLGTIPLTGSSNSNCLFFGGGYVDITTWDTMNLGSNFTIEFFFNADMPVIASTYFGFSDGSSLGASLSQSTGTLFFAVGFQGSLQNAPADLVELDTWQHFALVKQPGEYSIYIDGDLQFNGSLPGGTDGPYVFYGTDETGSRAIGDGWRGYLDEFRISDEALTPDQFLNHLIPEPSTLALGVLAGVTFLVFRSRRKLD